MKELMPSSIHRPFAQYAHGIEIPAGWRIVQTSGQLGIRPDGTIPADAAGQATVCFENVRAILAEAGMGPDNIAHISAFVTDRDFMEGYMRARDDFVGANRLPASTLLIVTGFTRPEFKVEVEVVAAAP